MLYAYYQGKWVRASRGLKGTVCPDCRGPVKPKCGDVIPPYFSHLPGCRCDPWTEPETPWHLNWKAGFPPAWCEVRLEAHRADVHTPGGVTVEFQHSAILPDHVQQRTEYYAKFGPVHWVLDVTQQTGWPTTPAFDRPHVYCNYVWRTPRPSFLAVFGKGYLWLHLPGDALLRLDTLADPAARCWYGQGCLMRRADWLVAMCQGGELPPVWRALKYAVVQAKIQGQN